MSAVAEGATDDASFSAKSQANDHHTDSGTRSGNKNSGVAPPASVDNTASAESEHGEKAFQTELVQSTDELQDAQASVQEAQVEEASNDSTSVATLLITDVDATGATDELATDEPEKLSRSSEAESKHADSTLSPDSTAQQTALTVQDKNNRLPSMAELYATPENSLDDTSVVEVGDFVFADRSAPQGFLARTWQSLRKFTLSLVAKFAKGRSRK